MKTSTFTLAAGLLVASPVYAAGTFSLGLSKRSTRDPSQSHKIYRRQNSNAGTVEESVFDILPWSTGGAYYTNISVGTPPQTITVILDTGSSDLYVDASSSATCKDTSSPNTCRGGSFDSSSSSTYKVVIPNGFNTSFGDGSSASGDFATDNVGLGDVVLSDVQMGIASTVDSTTGFAVSLMGVGYSANEAADTAYPNMPEILHQSGAINSRLYSVFLNDLGDSTGTILFGGIDTAKYTGQLVTLDILPVIQQDPSTGQQFGAVYQFKSAVTGVSSSVKGKTTTYLSNGDPTGQKSNSLPVLLDTGSSAWTVPASLYNNLAKIFGNDLDNQGSLPCTYQNQDISLTVEFGGQKSITVPVRDLVVPVYDPSNNQQYTTNSGAPLCAFMISPDEGGQQQQESGFLTLGDAVLRSMYVVFDLDNGQLSIAQAVANATTDASGSSSGNNIKVVKAGPSGVASAVGNANSGVATASANTNTIAPEVTATRSLGFSTAPTAVGTATGQAAIPAQGDVDADTSSGSGSGSSGSGSSSGSGTSSGSGSGSSTSSTSKGAASSLTVPTVSWSVLGVFGVWAGMAIMGASLVL